MAMTTTFSFLLVTAPHLSFSVNMDTAMACKEPRHLWLLARHHSRWSHHRFLCSIPNQCSICKLGSVHRCRGEWCDVHPGVRWGKARMWMEDPWKCGEGDMRRAWADRGAGLISARELDSSQLSKGWSGSRLNRTAHSFTVINKFRYRT